MKNFVDQIVKPNSFSALETLLSFLRSGSAGAGTIASSIFASSSSTDGGSSIVLQDVPSVYEIGKARISTFIHILPNSCPSLSFFHEPAGQGTEGRELLSDKSRVDCHWLLLFTQQEFEYRTSNDPSLPYR